MTDTTNGQIVFTEIPASDPERACRFYETLLQAPLTKEEGGPNPIWVLPHAEGAHATGHIYPGEHARKDGMTAHFAVPDDLEAAMVRVKMGGGEIVSGVVDIPVGSFFYAKDTEGNSLGIFRFRS